MWYSIVALEDRKPVSEFDGMELRTEGDVSCNKKEAIARAKEVLKDQELIDAGMVKVEVRDESNEVEWDGFVS